MSKKDATWLALFERTVGQAPSLVERTCAAVRQAVAAGYLRRGDRLPASRTLAADLGVSRVTVEAAFGRLEAEGYVVRNVGSGTFVAIDSTVGTRRDQGEMPRRAELSLRGANLVATGGCVDAREALAFTAGFPDLQAFPINVWRQITARRLKTDPTRLLSYGDPQGLEELREAVATYLFQSRGVNCSANQILITTSSQQALSMIATLLLDPTDDVWVEDPCYSGAMAAFTSAGATIHGITVDEAGMQIPDAGQYPPPKVIYVTPSHQYPTGATLSLERRILMLGRRDLETSWIVEDDYDSEFRYGTNAVPALQGLDKRQRVIYVGTFSKSLFPSLRIAYVVLPPALVSAFVVARTTYDGHPAQLSQAIAADFLAQGHFTAHVRQMRVLYQARRECLEEELQRHAPELVTSSSTAAGLQCTVFSKVPSDVRVAEIAARQHGLELPCLSPLYVGSQKRQGWILGYVALNIDAIRLGARQLGAVLRSMRS